MRRASFVVAIAGVVLAVTGPAVASDLVATTTTLKVRPGQDAVFRSGDPIKICYGATTAVVVDAPVYIRIEMRDARAGAKWREVGTAKQQANKTRCFTGEVQTNGVDILLRAITLRGEQVDWSVSKLRRLDVA